MKKIICAAAVVASAVAIVGAGAAQAGVYKLDVTVTSEAGARFSAPFFTFTNLSSPGLQVAGVGVSSGPPWDWNANIPNTDYVITNPAGGTRTLLEGEEANHDLNNGVTPAIRYSLTSFDPGDFFRFSSDPEGPQGQSFVVDVRPWLVQDLLRITVNFAGGPTLTGTDWTEEFINPNLSHSLDSNQLYRLTLQQSFADPKGGVPEPASWALMIAGFGMSGAMLRRRSRAAA